MQATGRIYEGEAKETLTTSVDDRRKQRTDEFCMLFFVVNKRFLLEVEHSKWHPSYAVIIYADVPPGLAAILGVPLPINSVDDY